VDFGKGPPHDTASRVWTLLHDVVAPRAADLLREKICRGVVPLDAPGVEVWIVDAQAAISSTMKPSKLSRFVKVKAKSLFEALNMPQKPDGLRILDQDGDEVFFWTKGADDA
jgi:hypothetical protein